MPRKLAVLCISLLVFAVPAWAGNGHLLHGVGAINSSMGGSGTGLPVSPMGAMHNNPALLTGLEGWNVEISVEFFKDDLSMTTEGVKPKHTSESDGEIGVLPAVAWSGRQPGKKVAYGWGLMAIAGFRTNWAADPDSIVVAPQGPDGGFGRLNTELAVTKVPFGVSWQATKKFSFGGSLNIYQNRLIINPLPTVRPDCNAAVPDPGYDPTQCWRPLTGVPVTEFAMALQLGFYWQFSDMWSLGLSFTSEQDADPYVWNSEYNNPNNATYEQPREVSIDLDQPPIASVGIGIQATDKLSFALDARWVGYADTDGIGGTGGIDENGVLISIGWDDIWIGMFGLRYQATEKVEIRAGLNFNQSPIREEVALNSGGTPSVFEQHYTFGISGAVTKRMSIDFGTYYTPENSVTGPIYGANTQPITPASTVTLTSSIFSVQLGFSFKI